MQILYRYRRVIDMLTAMAEGFEKESTKKSLFHAHLVAERRNRHRHVSTLVATIWEFPRS